MAPAIATRPLNRIMGPWRESYTFSSDVPITQLKDEKPGSSDFAGFLRGTSLAQRFSMRTLLAVVCLLLAGAVRAEAQLRTVTFVSGLSSPIAFEQDPSDATVQYIAEQRGVIRLVRNGVLQSTPFLDISSLVMCCSERGLLGLAFSPDYGTTGRFYVNYTRAGDGRMVVARYNRSANPLVADTQGVPLIWSTGENSIRHPFTNHNAGCLAFGPDGFLYIAQGDGGSGGDPENNAQNTSELLGKILRIDVSVPDGHPQGFAVPAGNAGLPRPEIWSLGWRNPWKFSFDQPSRGGTGAMLVADVGQDGWEEIDYEPAGRSGRNYGWRVREGAHPYTGSTTAAARRSDPRLRPRRWPIDHGWICLPGRFAADDARPVLLRRLRQPPRVVARAAHQFVHRRSLALRGVAISSTTPPSSAARRSLVASAPSASTPRASCTSSITRPESS